MAGDWLKIEKATLGKPEVFAIAQALEIDSDEVIGKLLRVWDWFDTYTTDGKTPRLMLKRLEQVLGCTQFLKAMQDVGWLKVTANFAELPNFDRHNGQTAKARALGKNRAKSHRSKSEASNAASVTQSVTPTVTQSVTQSVTNVTQTVTQPVTQRALPEKRREEIEKRRGNGAPAPFPSKIYNKAWVSSEPKTFGNEQHAQKNAVRDGVQGGASSDIPDIPDNIANETDAERYAREAAESANAVFGAEGEDAP